jgi:hypothetical protein
MVRRLASAYFAGAVAALATSLLVWVVARADLLALLGVSWEPRLSWDWLEPRLLWGSFWALGLPTVRRRLQSVTRAALVLSLGPALFELFYLLPEGGHGMLGVGYGALTPVFVLGSNALWGWIVSLVVVRAEGAS